VRRLESNPGAHAEAHLREAVSVTARAEGGGIEIQLGHLCNNRCVFCVSGQLTEQRLARRIPFAPVEAALEAAAANGVRRVTLLGGEPTIQRSFLPALRRAQALGFEEIVIFTNGVRTAQPKFLREVCALGRFTWRFSIQGGDEASHDRVTQTPGSFAKILAGMEALGAAGQRITANACVTAFSHEAVEGYVDLVERYGIDELHLDMIRPESAGLRSPSYHRTIQARYSDIAASVARMLDRFTVRLPDFEVHVGNLPFCVLPDWTRAIHHGGQDTATVTTDDRGDLSRVHHKYSHQRDGMEQPPACAPCAFRDRCRGVPSRYLEMFGAAEFVPILESQRARRRRRLARLLIRLARVGDVRVPTAADGGCVDGDGVRLIARLEGDRTVVTVEPMGPIDPAVLRERGAAMLDAFR
jgi:MoaA/NifB/PqqE/SkfB family radical SAM enzyme